MRRDSPGAAAGSGQGMLEAPDPRPEEEGFGEASLGEAQSSDSPDDPEMIFDDADDVEDADVVLGLDDPEALDLEEDEDY
jgi:hypothetical protein